MVVGGERIAYRGHPDTPDAGKWVSTNPDKFVIRDHGDAERCALSNGRVLLFNVQTT
jgi:hypothetical protein